MLSPVGYQPDVQESHNCDSCGESYQRYRLLLKQMLSPVGYQPDVQESHIAAILVAKVIKGTGVYWTNAFAIYLTWPSPSIRYLMVVSALIPIGPRACIFWVLIPSSAPKPNSPPSVNLVLAFT